MGKFIDLTNKKFVRLKVLKRAEDYIHNNRKFVMWLCECKCGKQVVVKGESLRNGLTKSCGCLNSELVSERNKILKKKYNRYDLSGEYGIGYTTKGEPFYFNLEDYDKIKDDCWHITNEGYVATTMNKNTILFHNLLFPDAEQIDHQYHNKSDNRKCNLRTLTKQQNSFNSVLSCNNTSGVTGVTWNKVLNKWCAFIGFNNKKINLGYFINFDDAVKARKEAEEKYFGEYSYDNSMKGSDQMVNYNIYLSGGMFGLSLDEQMKWRNKIVNAIKYGDYEYFKNPIFISPPLYYNYEGKNHKSEREIFEFELNHIRKADLVIVNFNVPKSIGTAMELMLAKEHNIPVIGINADGHELHPWLELCTTRMCDNIREAVNHVVNFYLN